MSAYDLLGSLVLDDGRRWGEAALDFQRADAAAVLDLDGPRRHFWTRPRGASKTTDLAGVSVAALLDQLPPRSRGLVYAADKAQAGLLLDSAAGLADRTGLGSALTIGASSLTATRTEATLTIESSDDASAWGQRPHFTVIEEYSIWRTTRGPTRLMAAVMSAIPKVPTARAVVLAMPGDPSHPAHKLLERARTSDAWRVSEVRGPTPWWSPEDVAEAKADLTDSDFRRLVLGEWCASEGRLTSADDVRACVRESEAELPFEQGHRYVMGLDLGLTKDRAVLTIGHAEQVDRGEDRTSTMVVVDRMAVWQGSKAAPVSIELVEATILEAWHAYGRPRLVVDPWNAAMLVQRLRRRGVRVVEHTFSQASNSRRAVMLYRLLRDHLLDLPDDEELVDELATVRLDETAPGVYRVEHEQGAHDDRVASLGLVAHQLLSGPARRTVRFSGAVG